MAASTATPVMTLTANECFCCRLFLNVFISEISFSFTIQRLLEGPPSWSSSRRLKRGISARTCAGKMVSVLDLVLLSSHYDLYWQLYIQCANLSSILIKDHLPTYCKSCLTDSSSQRLSFIQMEDLRAVYLHLSFTPTTQLFFNNEL